MYHCVTLSPTQYRKKLNSDKLARKAYRTESNGDATVTDRLFLAHSHIVAEAVAAPPPPIRPYAAPFYFHFWCAQRIGECHGCLWCGRAIACEYRSGVVCGNAAKARIVVYSSRQAGGRTQRRTQYHPQNYKSHRLQSVTTQTCCKQHPKNRVFSENEHKVVSSRAHRFSN